MANEIDYTDQIENIPNRQPITLDLDKYRVREIVARYINQWGIQPPFNQGDLDNVAWLSMKTERERIIRHLRDSGFSAAAYKLEAE